MVNIDGGGVMCLSRARSLGNRDLLAAAYPNREIPARRGGDRLRHFRGVLNFDLNAHLFHESHLNT